MLAGHWQAASFDEDRPLRCRELMKVTSFLPSLFLDASCFTYESGQAFLDLTLSVHTSRDHSANAVYSGISSDAMLQTNMASAMEISQRELFFATGNTVICVTGSLHAVSAAQEFVQ